MNLYLSRLSWNVWNIRLLLFVCWLWDWGRNWPNYASIPIRPWKWPRENELNIGKCNQPSNKNETGGVGRRFCHFGIDQVNEGLLKLEPWQRLKVHYIFTDEAAVFLSRWKRTLSFMNTWLNSGCLLKSMLARCLYSQYESTVFALTPSDLNISILLPHSS